MDEFNQSDDIATPEDKRGWRDVTLKGAGYGLVAGDIAMAIAALNPSGTTRDYHKFTTSLLYSLGGVTVAKYGNPKLDKQLELLEAKLARHLKDNHVAIPKGSMLDKASLAESGALGQVEQFLYTYPSEVMNAVLGMGGAFAVLSGKQQGNFFSKAYGCQAYLFTSCRRMSRNPTARSIARCTGCAKNRCAFPAGFILSITRRLP